MWLLNLPEVELARIAGFCMPRDLEALTVASRTVHRYVLPRFPLWEQLFCFRWAMLNYALPGATTNEAKIVLDTNVRELFPSTCTNSRIFQLLAHAIVRVPTYADIAQTEKAKHYDKMRHTLKSLSAVNSHVVDVAYSGWTDARGDLCVRSNVPFSTDFHVAVFARKPKKKWEKLEYHVGIVNSGYFEVTLKKHMGTKQPREMISIGTGPRCFRLVTKHPGFGHDSFGYNSRTERWFIRAPQVYGPSFDLGDTVGCGVRPCGRKTLIAFFSNNGKWIPPIQEELMECRRLEMFPMVGMCQAYAVHINYGQEPFCNDKFVDEFLAECKGKRKEILNDLQWHEIHESDAEEWEDEWSDNDDEDY